MTDEQKRQVLELVEKRIPLFTADCIEPEEPMELWMALADVFAGEVAMGEP